MKEEYIEKEIKLKIEDHQKIVGYLTSHGAQLLNKSMEKTTRFDTPRGELERKGIFLRVRSGSKNTITMKEKIGTDKNVRSRKETEFVIENIEAMKYILSKLGFTNTKIMEKYRINWLYKNTKLSLDELPFGIFLEIEGDERRINTVIKELGFSEKDKILKTYWDILDENNIKNGEKDKDITFSKDYKFRLMQI